MKPPRILVRPAAPAEAREGAPAHRLPGETVEGRITAIEGDDVILELDAGGTGILSVRDFMKFPTVGDRASGTYLTHDPGAGGAGILTTRAAATEVDPKAVAPGTLVRGTVIEAGRPGIRVRIGGVTGFFPASQLPSGLLKEPGRLLRQELIGIVTEVRGGELLLGLRPVLAERERRRTAERIAAFREGQRVIGTVARRTEFGYFVDLGGVDGLLHVSRVEKHAEKRRAAGEEPLAIEPRQRLEVIVSRVEAERGRIALDLPDPERPLPAAAGAPAGAPAARAGSAPPAAAPEPVEVNGILREIGPAGGKVFISSGVEGWIPAARFGRHSPRPGELRSFRIVGRDPQSGRLELSLELRGDTEDES